MVEALVRETERSELREQFAADAAQPEQETLAGGKAFALGDTFDYLESRMTGKKVRRPRARAWRASK